MRKKTVFKTYSQTNSLLPFCPKKIKKFRHSKWKTFLKNISRVYKKTPFTNPFFLSPTMQKWAKYQLNYKSNLLVKRRFKQIYDQSVSSSLNLKHQKFELKYLYNLNIIKLEFRLDIVLFRLFLCTDIFSARKEIARGLILVNSKKVSPKYFLKVGDTVSFELLTTNVFKFIQRTFITNFFLSFVEIDFYSKNFIITKNFNDFSSNDIILLNQRGVSAHRLLRSLQR
jgi:ribosomal protein S4